MSADSATHAYRVRAGCVEIRANILTSRLDRSCSLDRNLNRNEDRFMAAELKVVSNATCTFCGCVCDDMELTVENNHITKAKNACVLGKAWFLNHHVEERPVATIKGQPVSLDEAVAKAA